MADKKTPKLHEVLAVEADLEGAAKILDEALVTFNKKVDHFSGHHKTLKMFDEARVTEEEGAEEHKEIVTTVDQKLAYLTKPIAKWWDALAQKERTNQEARADLVIDGEVLLEQVPATMLLGLESRLRMVRNVFDAIPTHPREVYGRLTRTMAMVSSRAATRRSGTKPRKLYATTSSCPQPKSTRRR